MMSGAVIERMSREAAQKAAQLKQEPFVVWPEDIRKWQAEGVRGFPFPYIGSYKSKGWRKVGTHFVDSSGFGAPGEPALTIEQFTKSLTSGRGYAVIEAGQFQVYVGEFVKVKSRAKAA